MNHKTQNVILNFSFSVQGHLNQANSWFCIVDFNILAYIKNYLTFKVKSQGHSANTLNSPYLANYSTEC